MSKQSRNLGVLVVVCCFIVVGLAFGGRQSFGLFLKPMTVDFGWGRESLSLVFAVQALLNGFAAPFAAAISDKWGTGRTVLGGSICYSLGLLVMAHSTSYGGVMLGGGVLIGMGVSACGMPVMLSAVARIAPEEKRSLWLGIVTAGGTAGQLAIVPLVHWLINHHGWSAALTVFACLFIIVIPIAAALGIANRQIEQSEHGASLSTVLRRASTHSGYLLLLLGFYVCGFQVQFIATHFPAFIADAGFSAALGATALMIIAFANMIGSWCSGYLGGKYNKKYLLSGIYLARAVLMVAFLLLPVTAGSIIMFSCVMGFIWLATVPLTGGLVGQIFGPRYMGTLYGFVFASHQLGNFTGAWLGGRIYDSTGSYDLVWWIAAGLGLAAAIIHFPIDDRPVESRSVANTS